MTDKEIIDEVVMRRQVEELRARVAKLRFGLPPSRQTVYTAGTGDTPTKKLIVREAKKLLQESETVLEPFEWA